MPTIINQFQIKSYATKSKPVKVPHAYGKHTQMFCDSGSVGREPQSGEMFIAGAASICANSELSEMRGISLHSEDDKNARVL